MIDFIYNIIIYPIYSIIEFIYAFASSAAGKIDFLKQNNLVTGLSIIAVSVGITLLCLPLYAVAEHWQEVERDKVNKMKPQVNRIKKFFTGDERYMITSTYYKQNNYSPIMALRSSFGLLIQIPFFLAAYSFLSHLPELNGSDFLFIKNLGQPDNIGNLGIHILPVLMTLINCISGVIYSKGHGIREKIQIFGMAAIFLVVLYNSPSGLVLYWTFNNIFSLVKNVFYKMKNPLKVLYICTVVICLVMEIAAIFFTKSKPQNKFIISVLFAIIFALPLIIKFIKYIVNTYLQELTNYKKTRHSVFIISCVLLFLLSGFVIPSALISSSAAEFANIGEQGSPSYFVWVTLNQALGLFIFWPVCVYFLFSKKVQTVLAVLISFVSISAVINTFLFMPRYGDIAQTLSFTNEPDFRTISIYSLANIAVLCVLSVFLIIAVKFKKSVFINYIIGILIFSLTAFSVINYSSISKNYKEYEIANKDGNLDKIFPIFHFSKNKQNVVLIMLDRAQSYFIEDMMNEDSELKEAFRGFTSYNNSLSYNGHTLMGAPSLFGGYEYTPQEFNRNKDVTLIEKNNNSQLVLPRIFTEKLNYKATVSDPTWINYKHFWDLSFVDAVGENTNDPYPLIDGAQTMERYTKLWYKEKNKLGIQDNTEDTLKRNLLYFSIFRQSPVILRQLVYKQGTYWSTNKNSLETKTVIDRYSALDYLTELTDVSETENGYYMSLINELTHQSFFLQAPEYIPANEVTDKGNPKYEKESSYHTEMASLKMIGKWLNYLREHGAYDNTRIIIASDHGKGNSEPYFEKDDNLDHQVSDYTWGRGHYHCLFMFKDFNSNEDFKIDEETFMTNADAPSMLLQGLIENPVNPFTNKAIPIDTTDMKKDGIYITTSDLHQPHYHGDYVFEIDDKCWWHVKSPIKNNSSWKQEKPKFLY